MQHNNIAENSYESSLHYYHAALISHLSISLLFIYISALFSKIVL